MDYLTYLTLAIIAINLRLLTICEQLNFVIHIETIKSCVILSF